MDRDRRDPQRRAARRRLPARRGPATVASAGRGFGYMYGNPFIWLIETIIEIFIWLLIAQAILSWLLAFGVVNRYNRGVAVVGDFLYRITEPALRPIRRILPNLGGIDISPIILILLLLFLERLILYYAS
jgi:YggT family protein